MLGELVFACEFPRLRKFSQPTKFRRVRNSQPADTFPRHPVFACNSPFPYNSSFHAPAMNFSNFWNHAINGH